MTTHQDQSVGGRVDLTFGPGGEYDGVASPERAALARNVDRDLPNPDGPQLLGIKYMPRSACSGDHLDLPQR